MTGRLRGLMLLAALLAFWPLQHEAAAQTTPLRLCADPDNLPFSSKNPATPGIYIELGQEIAAALGRPFAPVWAPTYYTKKEVRSTLLAGLCDGFIGLPDDPHFMGTRLIFSKPIVKLGYALVTPPSAAISGLADLDGLRVAVQFGSPPQNLLAERDKVHMVTVLSAEEGMRDLAQKRADAAFIWGPSAGWVNRSQLHDAYKVVPIEGPYMQWEVAIAFPRGREQLRAAVDRALSGLGPKIETLMGKYGFPRAKPMRLAQSAALDPGSSKSVSVQKVAVVAPGPAKPAANSKDIAAGRDTFNAYCEHCHGPDAITGVEERNLRHLVHENGLKMMDQAFWSCVLPGRVDKGMPSWKGVLSHVKLAQILAWLHTVQSP
jgi:polar amino acid transport system substrate-binding protein